MQSPGVVTPAVLTRELLDEYESRLRRSGLSVVEHLHPGLDPAEIDDRTRPLGLRLPGEARTWFAWHDGAEQPGYDVEIAPSFVILSLDEAIEWYRTAVDDATSPYRLNAGSLWRPEWFPLLRAYGFFACDCSVPEGAPSPVRVIGHGDTDFHEPRAASLGDMITLWIGAWDSGAWYADLERDTPHRRRSHADDHGRRHPLLDV